MMFRDELDAATRDAFMDRFDVWELIELLEIDVGDLLDAFPQQVNENLQELLELADLAASEEEEDVGGN